MSAPLRVAITGASGLVGSALTARLRAEGHTPVPMVRRAARPGEIHWDPDGHWDPTPLSNVDAIVHLAGESIADGRWTAARKARIEQSRIHGTRCLVDYVCGLRQKPGTLISASAMGYYGDQGDRPLDESSPAGTDWLGRVAAAWEGEAVAATRFGTRVVLTRFGLLFSPDGGALAKMLPPFRLGIGGRLGSGRQWMSWITVADTSRAIVAALTDERYTGAINVSTPHPVTNAEFTATLGAVLGRPTFATVPRTALRLLLGELADAALLASQRLVPARLTALGFEWNEPSLDGALRHLLAR